MPKQVLRHRPHTAGAIPAALRSPRSPRAATVSVSPRPRTASPAGSEHVEGLILQEVSGTQGGLPQHTYVSRASPPPSRYNDGLPAIDVSLTLPLDDCCMHCALKFGTLKVRGELRLSIRNLSLKNMADGRRDLCLTFGLADRKVLRLAWCVWCDARRHSCVDYGPRKVRYSASQTLRRYLLKQFMRKVAEFDPLSVVIDSLIGGGKSEPPKQLLKVTGADVDVDLDSEPPTRWGGSCSSRAEIATPADDPAAFATRLLGSRSPACVHVASAIARATSSPDRPPSVSSSEMSLEEDEGDALEEEAEVESCVDSNNEDESSEGAAGMDVESARLLPMIKKAAEKGWRLPYAPHSAAAPTLLPAECIPMCLPDEYGVARAVVQAAEDKIVAMVHVLASACGAIGCFGAYASIVASDEASQASADQQRPDSPFKPDSPRAVDVGAVPQEDWDGCVVPPSP